MSTAPGQRCFTIMPFTMREGDLPRYYDDRNHWNEVYRGLIVPAVKEAGLVCERDDEDSTSRLITQTIWHKMERSDVVLCDLSAHNPNVYLELGWALRADKRFVLIKDDITTFNFDLNQFYTYEYSHRLQPTSVRDSITALAGVIRSTLLDEERQYSMVRKLALQLQAVEAASQGNVEVGLLRNVLAEIRSAVAGPGTSAATNAPQFSFAEIASQSDLQKMLVGTTWRKKNNLEHVIFAPDGEFYNNHAGHPQWRPNRYKLGQRLGSMTLFWSVDGLAVQCEFNDQFNEFVELSSPVDCRWSIIAREPHTPVWGV